MRWQSLLGVVLILSALLTVSRTASAGGYWRFYISVDGKPAFTGGIGVFGEYLPLEHLESSVTGGVQLGTDSYLDENTTGDVTLTGDVVFRDQHHPPLHMKRLRLVYDRHESDRANGTTVAGGYYDWRLHPDDAAFIVAHYRGETKSTSTRSISLFVGAIVIANVVIASVCLIVWGLLRRRPLDQGQVKLKTI